MIQISVKVREERKAEEKRKKKIGAFATPKRRGRVDDLRRQTLMNASNVSASSRGQRSASVASNKAASVRSSGLKVISLYKFIISFWCCGACAMYARNPVAYFKFSALDQ